MRLHATALLLTLCTTFTSALHESDVGVVDWYKQQIGVPLHESSSTAPIFHRVGSKNNKNTQSVVISATGSNVLAALNPVDGAVVWRYIFEAEDRIATFHKQGSVVASLSGPGGATLRSFDVLTGDLLLERRLHEPTLGRLSEPNHIGTFVAFGNRTYEEAHPDLLALTNGYKVTLLSGSGAQKKWEWVSEDQSSLVIYSTILPTLQAIYIVGLSKSFSSYTLHVTALSPLTGTVLSSLPIPSSISNGLTDFLTLSTPGFPPSVVWLENGSIKSFALTPTLQGKTATLKGATYKRLVDVGLGKKGMVVGVKGDGAGQIVALEEDGKGLAVLKEFEGSAPSEMKTESMYAGGFDKDGYPYVVRLYWSHFLRLASVEIFAPHLANGRGLLAGYSFAFDTNTHGVIKHMAIDTANPSSHALLGRLVLTTSTGAVQLWQQDKLQWTREEGLTEIVSTKFVEMPEKVGGSGEARGEGFVERVKRQIKEGRELPAYLGRFVKRFVFGEYESAVSSASVKGARKGVAVGEEGVPERDAFGFRQVIVCATAYGKVYGVDSSNGEVFWSRILGLGGSGEGKGEEGRMVPVEDGMFVFRTVADTEVEAEAMEAKGEGVEGGKGPEVVVVARRLDSVAGESMAVLYHFNALTGRDVVNPEKKPQKPALLKGIDVFPGVPINAYLLDAEKSRVVVLLDSQLKVHLYPNTEETRASFVGASTSSSLSVSLKLAAAGQARHNLVGYQFSPISPDSSSSSTEGRENLAVASAYPTWTLSLPPGEDILDIIKPSRGPVASLGKVLGNRTTLYKYLNERMVGVVTASHSSPSYSAAGASEASRCGVYLVDGVKGSVIYHASVPVSSRGAGGCDAKVALTENWLVYYYYDEEYQGPGQAKGGRMVSVEVYEGKGVDEKLKSSEVTAYSNKNLDVTVYEQSFVYPHEVLAIASTGTKFGITSKDIIVANANNKIQTISRRLLNPRRPVNRKPTNEELEEFLIQYDPLLPDDPRKVLSHTYQVANTKRIITSPALLESTSLVFAYGLDLFLTRVTPSNTFDVLSENFNKVQLVLTVAGLAGAILVTKPMVGRKKLRERWYN